MVKLQSLVTQRIPLILQMRNVICARRQNQLINRYSSLFTLSIFAGPILCLLCYGIYRASRYFVDAKLPVETLLLLLIVTWIGIGLTIQLQLHRDLRWNAFVRMMPVQPIAVLTVYFWRAIPVCLLGILCLSSGLGGIGVRLWSVESYPVWLGLGLAFAWGMSLQVLLGIVLSLSSFWGRLFRIALLLWWGYLVARTAGHIESWDAGLVRMNRLLVHDPVIVVCGLRSILGQLGGTEEASFRQGWVAVFHVGLLIGLQMMLTWIGARRLPVLTTVINPRYLIVSKVSRRVIARWFRGHRHAQGAIECVRMARSGCTMLLIYLFLCMGAGVFLQMYFWGDNYSILAVVVFVMLALSERVAFLKLRKADVLNYQYGVSTKDYLYGLNIAVGTLITSMCVVQLPISWNCRLQDVIACIVACTALAYSSLMMCVIFDAYYRHTKCFQSILTVVIFMIALTEAWSLIPPLIIVSFNIICVPCVVYGVLLLVLSYVNVALVLVAGVFALWYGIRQTEPGFVKRYFWRSEE